MAKYGLNKVSLIGNLGFEPEMSHTDQGVPYTRLRLALTERFRSRDGADQDRTEWVEVTLWRSQAEIAKRSLRKGASVYIEGRLRNHAWETPQGERRSRLEIEGNRLILLDGPQSNDGPPFEGGAPAHGQVLPPRAPSHPRDATQTPPTQHNDPSARSEDGDTLPF
jgi:single-strand DNA-binding protein